MSRALFILAASLFTATSVFAQSSAGPAATTCGVPAAEAGATPQQAIFPPGQYPVTLPATVDAQGNVYGADVNQDVRKFVPTRARQTN